MVRAAKSRSACVIAPLASTILFVATSASAQDASPPPPTVAPPPQIIIVTDRPHATLFGDVRYRSPGVAVALSLTPAPVDFGNLYAENVGWGIAYTALELSLGSAMMWMGANHMCHDPSTRCGDWSDTERNSMIGLASGYVLVKLGAGVHAGYAAGEYNRDHERLALPMIRPTSGGAVFSWGASF